MIIGIVHVEEFENHELHGLLPAADRVESHTPTVSPNLAQRYTDILLQFCNRVYVFGSQTHIVGAVNYPTLTKNSRNSPSILSTCVSHQDAIIVTVDARTVWTDWERFTDELIDMTGIALKTGVFALMSAPPRTDLCMSMMNSNHFVARKDGVSLSGEVLDQAQKDRQKFDPLGYRNYSGTAAFPARNALRSLMGFMPTYHGWVFSSSWRKINQLSFEEAVLENIHGFHNFITDNICLPQRHPYHLWEYLRLTHPDPIPDDRFGMIHDGEWEISARYIVNDDIKIELIPGVYYKDGNGDIGPRVFQVDEKDYRTFGRNITLVRFVYAGNGIKAGVSRLGVGALGS